MAHFSHAYPDGCCIYFSFAGAADPGLARERGWDAACEATYDRDVARARSRPPSSGRDARAPPRRRPIEGAATRRGARRGRRRRAFADAGVRPARHPEPGQPRSGGVGFERRRRRCRRLHTRPRSRSTARASSRASRAPPPWPSPSASSARSGSPSAQRLRPANGRCPNGSRGARPARATAGSIPQTSCSRDSTRRSRAAARCRIRPAPRRAVGPDLTALLVGAGGRFGRVDRAWMRVHPIGARRHEAPAFALDRDPPVSQGEASLLDAIGRAL